MKRAHSPAVPTLPEGLPPPQQPVVDGVSPCPLMLLRRSRTASQPISVGDTNNKNNNIGTSSSSISSSTSSSRKVDNATASTVAGLGRPTVLRTLSDSCIPRAPRMSSSQPNPLFLESLPQLSLPPPSVEDGKASSSIEKKSNRGGGERQKLSSSLRERMGSLAANFMLSTATSCPGSVGDGVTAAEWRLDQNDEGMRPSAAVGPSSASLTALSLLVSKAFPTAGSGAGAAACKEERRHGGLAGVRLDGSSLSSSLPAMQLPPPALAISTTPRTTRRTTRRQGSGGVADAHAHGRKEGEAPFSFSAFTASTAATTTASSVSSAGDGLEEDEDMASAGSSAASALSSSSASSQASEGEEEEGEEAVGSPSADAAMGPFVLEELSLEH